MSNFVNHKIENLIQAKDYEGLRKILLENPFLANQGIGLDETKNSPKAHPLHRIGDAVFAGQITEEEGIKIAGIFLEAGADINGVDLAENQDSPLTAVISLYADKVAHFYIEKGANIHHKGCHGGTALHWAAWCGSDVLVKKLIALGAEINQLCVSFKSTPLIWALHGLKSGREHNKRQQAVCAKILLENGADKTSPNFEGYFPHQFLEDNQQELRHLLIF